MVISMTYSGKTDIGQKRMANQDAIAMVEMNDGSLVTIVCDGMGGVKGGAVASEAAISAFTEYISEVDGKTDEDAPIPTHKEMLTEGLKRANISVYTRSIEDEQYKGMGTTLVAAVIKDRDLCAVNVGDSRLYVITGGGLCRVTRDHSYVQQMVDAGMIKPEDAKKSPFKNVITRVVGRETDPKPDYYSVKLPEGKWCVLLCSDGLYNFCSDEKLVALSEDESLSAEEAASAMIDAANEGGGGDNISAIIVRGD